MPTRGFHPEEHELTRRLSRDSESDSDGFNLDDVDPTSESQAFIKPSLPPGSPWLHHWRSVLCPGQGHGRPSARRSPRTCFPRRKVRHLSCALVAVLAGLLLLLVVASLLDPSYSTPPAHYQALREQAWASGYANPRNESVFIAANIVDEALIRGAWGQAVLDLVSLLGPAHVFLSIYENDSGPGTAQALQELKLRVPCDASIVSDHLPLADIATVTLPTGERRIKRVAYLAEVRNRALSPLEAHGTRFDKLLFLNDVIFAPLDAAQLLFSTNLDLDGRTKYRAACAVDFINPFKFYDTFASRDLEGYSMGVPFFPWFSNAGAGESRRDVLAGKDAVRVRSCWGGMVAFEAKWFQPPLLTEGSPTGKPHAVEIAKEAKEIPRRSTPGADNAPVRFRSETDTFWDASECCLIHADLQPARTPGQIAADTEIFVNPFVRVAYGTWTFGWLGTTRRWEKLYTIPHDLVNRLAGLPSFNPRRTEIEGEEVLEKVWVNEDGMPRDERRDVALGPRAGSYQSTRRTAGRGGFCGTRKLLVLKTDPRPGEKMWESLPVPAVSV
ncbi:MAG: hypothetical protein M1838_004220 [Thelocarpon superellum]|nr:MAG: hypothetical protein M1838_004220 [Thelocarpon superellum]